MSSEIVWTLQTEGTECGDNNMNVSITPTSVNMTVIIMILSWSGVESAGMEEQTMSWREEQ
jgi:hypothetical protein